MTTGSRSTAGRRSTRRRTSPSRRVLLPRSTRSGLGRWNGNTWSPPRTSGRRSLSGREGDAQCVDNRGKAFKGRKCAEKVSREYRLMQADLYNLYPAIGAVNALRQNYNFQMLPGRGARVSEAAG